MTSLAWVQRCTGYALVLAATALAAGCGGDDEGGGGGRDAGRSDLGEECFRALDCVRACDGPVVSMGCTCPSGTFDRLSGCPDATAPDAGEGPDASGGPDAAGGEDAATEDGGGPGEDAAPGDGGSPRDMGAACETMECFRPYECVRACGQDPFYVGCCECPPGSIDRISCPPDHDAGSPMCPPECFRPYICVERCGGPILSSGCCPCPPGTIDSVIDCRPDAGGGGLGEGEACGGELGACGAGLSCCYPCGIPGCTNRCEPTCAEGSPGCAGGCLLRP